MSSARQKPLVSSLPDRCADEIGGRGRAPSSARGRPAGPKIRGALLAIVGASILGALGCSFLFDVGALSDGETLVGPVPGDAANGADAANGVSAANGKDASGRCPEGKGPPSIYVSNDAGIAFCIDATEVTRAQYQVFLDETKGDASGQPSECAFNTSYEPRKSDDTPPPQGHIDLPVTFVDWCDAFAYCAWAGKRLCGRIGGGPADFNNPGRATDSQWMFACSAGGTQVYPYGPSFISNVCNNGAGPSPAAATVKSYPNCVGGFPGLFDMSGNVEEWENSCSLDRCLTRGASSLDNRNPDADVFSCAVPFRAEGSSRKDREEDVGFRCCSDSL